MNDDALNSLLVSFDASAAAGRALQYAIRMARLMGRCRIVVVTVHPAPLAYGEVQVYLGQQQAKLLLAEHDAAVLGAADEALAGSGIPYALESRQGLPASVIAARAAELGCQQIVMGTRGLGRMGGLLLGSVAAAVIEKAHCPVTLVK